MECMVVYLVDVVVVIGCDCGLGFDGFGVGLQIVVVCGNEVFVVEVLDFVVQCQVGDCGDVGYVLDYVQVFYVVVYVGVYG